MDEITKIVEDNIEEYASGRMYMKTSVYKKIAKLLGGDFNALSKIGRTIFKTLRKKRNPSTTDALIIREI